VKPPQAQFRVRVGPGLDRVWKKNAPNAVAARRDGSSDALTEEFRFLGRSSFRNTGTCGPPRTSTGHGLKRGRFPDDNGTGSARTIRESPLRAIAGSQISIISASRLTGNTKRLRGSNVCYPPPRTKPDVKVLRPMLPGDLYDAVEHGLGGPCGDRSSYRVNMSGKGRTANSAIQEICCVFYVGVTPL